MAAALQLVSRCFFAGVYAVLGAMLAGCVAFLALTAAHAFSLEPTASAEFLVVAGLAGGAGVAMAIGYLRRS